MCVCVRRAEPMPRCNFPFGCWTDRCMLAWLSTYCGKHTHTCQHGDPCYYEAFMCLCNPIAQHQAKCTALTFLNSSALNTGKDRYLWHRRYCSCGSPSLSFCCWNTYSHPSIYISFLSPLFAICCCSSLHSPFSICPSLISCYRLSIKGVEEVCHLTFLPADPFIFFKQRRVQRLTVGFRHLLFCRSVSLTAQAFAISNVSWQKCFLGIEMVDLQIETETWPEIFRFRSLTGVTVLEK